MKVLVIGANGKVGRQVIERLQLASHQPVAMLRKAEQKPLFEQWSVPVVLGDLEGSFEHAFEGIEAVIFVAGSPEGAGAAENLLVDQEGAISAINFAEKYGVKRFLLLSVKNADQPYLSMFEKTFIIAKHRADEYLKKSLLNYTIIRPWKMTDEEPAGFVQLQAHIPEDFPISRGDVAEVLVKLLNVKAAENQEFDLQSGTMKIENLLI